MKIKKILVVFTLVLIGTIILEIQAEASQRDEAISLITGSNDNAYWVYDGGSWNFSSVSLLKHADDGNAYEGGLVIKELNPYGKNLIYFEVPVTFSDGSVDEYAGFCLEVQYNGKTYLGNLYYNRGGGKNSATYIVHRELRY